MNTRRKGFTLVEVLVALAIVSITLMSALRAADGHEQRRRAAFAPARGLGRGKPPGGTSRPRGLAASGNSARHRTWKAPRFRLARGRHRHAEHRLPPRRCAGFRDCRRIAFAGAPHRVHRQCAAGDGRMKSGRGFTLIELMTALLVLSLLALMSYRGLGGGARRARARQAGNGQMAPRGGVLRALRARRRARGAAHGARRRRQRRPHGWAHQQEPTPRRASCSAASPRRTASTRRTASATN